MTDRRPRLWPDRQTISKPLPAAACGAPPGWINVCSLADVGLGGGAVVGRRTGEMTVLSRSALAGGGAPALREMSTVLSAGAGLDDGWPEVGGIVLPSGSGADDAPGRFRSTIVLSGSKSGAFFSSPKRNSSRSAAS